MVSSNFFRWSYHELVLLTQTNIPRPGFCDNFSLCKSFYTLKRQHLTAWIFHMGCTTLKGVIALLQANNYLFDLSVWVATLSVWKCLKVFESVWSHLKVLYSEIKLYCSCILALLRIHGGIYLRTTKVQCKYGNLDWTISVKDWLSWQFPEKNILSRLKDCFWSLMLMMFHLNVFYLPVLKQVVKQHKMWNDVVFWFSQMIFCKAYIPLLIGA